jgi:hypothetical protein
MELMQLSPDQLRQAASLKEQIVKLQSQLASIVGGYAAPGARARSNWRARGSAQKAVAASAGGGKKLHWTQTPAGRATMAKLMAKRWRARRKGVA